MKKKLECSPEKTKQHELVGEAVNEEKTKYLPSSSKQSTHTRAASHVTIDSHIFKVVDNFMYLGTSFNINNSLKIQQRISLANNCQLRLSKQSKVKSSLKKQRPNLTSRLLFSPCADCEDIWCVCVESFRDKGLTNDYDTAAVGLMSYTRYSLALT